MGKIFFWSYYHFLQTFKPNANETAQKTKNLFYICVLKFIFHPSLVRTFNFLKKSLNRCSLHGECTLYICIHEAGFGLSRTPIRWVSLCRSYILQTGFSLRLRPQAEVGSQVHLNPPMAGFGLHLRTPCLGLVYICIHLVGFGLHLHPSGWVGLTSAAIRLGWAYICSHQVGLGLHLQPSGWVWFTSTSNRMGFWHIG